MGTVFEQNDTANTEEVSYPFSVAVRFRNAAKPYSFGTYDSSIQKGDHLVVETAQGLELGTAEADALSVEKYSLTMPTKPVIRRASETDLSDYQKNLLFEKDAFRVCNEEIEDLGLEMHLLSAQYTLDRAKILFVYIAEQRVDFRELLKRLGYKLRCRIELRQIGERDKAKMVGGIGMCGMECCCRRFKNHFDVISINMAKNQLLALNIEKLSGMCGKLMCCLKYEDQDYKELTEGLPKMGSQVEYEGTIYRITAMNVMSEEAKLENREEALFVSLADLREKGIPRKGVVQPKRKDGEEDGRRPVKKTVHANSSAPKVSMEVEIDHKAENKKDDSKKRNAGERRDNRNRNKEGNSNNNRRNNERRRDSSKEKRPEAKNVTVRTFKKKSAEGEAGAQ